MTDHMPLPDPLTVSGDPDSGVEVSRLPPSDGVSILPATAKVSAERITYLVKIAMGTTGFSCLSLLTHAAQFDQTQLDAMLAEATKIVLDLRVTRRRKAIAGGDFKLTEERDPAKARIEIARKNEEWFKADVALFEAVLCDKYGFLILKANSAVAALEPTAKL